MASNVDTRELARFEAAAHLWWQPAGEFKALHHINPVRLKYIRDRARLTGRNVLDVGCGGGLLAEGMARAGGLVTAIDLSAAALRVARRHAADGGLRIEYRRESAEGCAAAHPAAFDVITCMELVEHVPEPAALVRSCAELLRPGGDLFFATVNRTPLSYLLVILAAEYLMGIVRKGTHRYDRFVRPAELRKWGQQAGLVCEDIAGLRYVPVIGRASLCAGLSMNYMMHLKKKGQKGSHHAPVAKAGMV